MCSPDQSNLSTSNVLLTVLLCITLKPNGILSSNFVWLDMGLPNTGKESKHLERIRSVFVFYSYRRHIGLVAA